MCSRILAERLDKAARLAAEAGEEWAWNWRGAAVVTHAISPRVTYTSAEARSPRKDESPSEVRLNPVGRSSNPSHCWLWWYRRTGQLATTIYAGQSCCYSGTGQLGTSCGSRRHHPGLREPRRA